MRVVFQICLLLLLAGSGVFAQEPEPLDFFPHHVGDTWTYRYDNFSNENMVITEIVRDHNEDILIYHNNFNEPSYKIDSAFNVFFHPKTFDDFLEFKLTAKQGDFWKVTKYSKATLMARVEKRYKTLIFGYPSTVMAINYYEVPEPDTVITGRSSYWYTYYLASGFGFIRQIGEAGDVYIDLVGCIINGKTFGTVTDVNEVSDEASPRLTAFPNPCSAFTVLRCSLPLGAIEATLSVTDIFGNNVHTASINNDDYILDTSRFTNGIYFCSVRVGAHTTTVPIIIQP